MRIYIGIDHSLSCTGICLMSDGSEDLCRLSNIPTNKSKMASEISGTAVRMNKIRKSIFGLMVGLIKAGYKSFRICLETTTGASSANVLAGTWWTILGAVYHFASEVNIEVLTVHPTNLKTFTTGNYKADKRDMMEAYNKWSTENPSFPCPSHPQFDLGKKSVAEFNDMADAWALAIYAKTVYGAREATSESEHLKATEGKLKMSEEKVAKKGKSTKAKVKEANKKIKKQMRELE